MIDYSQIKARLALLMNCEEAELNKYSAIVESSAESVASMLRDADDIYRPEVAELCSTGAYIRILLSSQADSITSFKAGDISYTKSSSLLDNARELYSIALSACSGYLKDSDFAFKAV